MAASQRAIGESSNLAQIALSYTYNFQEQRLYDNVCILSVLAQCAIDNAKRKFDIDIMEEITLIKQSMDISHRGYPQFWSIIRPMFNRERINKKLKCPMNYIYKLKPASYKPDEGTLPISEFFIQHKLQEGHKTSQRVEKLIQDYSMSLYNWNFDEDDDFNQYFLMKEKYDELIERIRSIYLSKNYLGLMSWLINRAFHITVGVRRNPNTITSKTKFNKSILMKTLFEVNPDAFLQCFQGKLSS